MVDYAKVRNGGSPARVLSRAMKGPAMTNAITDARHTLHVRHADWEDVRAAYVLLRDSGHLTDDDERMADWHECTDAWAGEVTRTGYDSSAWTATHEDGTTCSAWMDCDRSHGWVDSHHEDHEGDCLAWAEYPNGLVMPLDAYADAVTLAIRLNADEFRYWNGGDTVSVLVRYDGAESGYVTTHHEGI